MHSTSSREKRPSGVVAFVADVQFVLAVVEELEAAAEHAGDVGADLHVVLPRRGSAKHRIVAEDVADVELEEVEALGDLGDDGVGDIADLVLRVEQHGDEGGALDGVDRGQLVEAGGGGGSEDRVLYRGHGGPDSRRMERRALTQRSQSLTRTCAEYSYCGGWSISRASRSAARSIASGGPLSITTLPSSVSVKGMGAFALC